MTRSRIDTGAQPCLWMAAGLVDYKLCDRDFDCDHCPLEAALRGDSREAVGWGGHAAHRPPADHFPADRSYSTGHVWVQLAESNGGGHVGLDAFATSLLGRVINVRVPVSGPHDGLVVAELHLDSGFLPFTVPIPVDTVDPNPRLHEEPDLALTRPYDDGWLLAVAGPTTTDLEDLLDAEQALEQAQQDLRMFRRHVALEMLAETADLGRCMADGGEPLTDLRQILGAASLRSLLHQLIH